ncbi:MAG TPA: hypothetical protein VKB18_06945 [Gemmatimonadota bacterium]|nr:hypothetical protein [Gemmatimonadota bacterium]
MPPLSGTRRALSFVPLALLVALGTAPAPAAAQGRMGPVQARLGAAFDLAVPVGEFQEFVDTGAGIRGFGMLALDRAGVFGLRLDASYVVYGHQSRRVPLSPTVPLIDVEVSTDNQIMFGSLGPQMTFPIGPVRPFLRGGVGVSYFATTSKARGTSSSGDFASTTNQDDLNLALEGGGGLWIHLGGGRTPIDLSLEATYVHNGRARYLRKESIVTNPDGSVTLNPIESATNLMTFNVGLVFGIR